MMIEVIRNTVCPLARRRWVFSVTVSAYSPDDPVVLRLREYVEETRPSKRHRKWRAVSRYLMGERAALLVHASWIAEPPCPEDVKAEALQQLAKRVEFLVG